METRNFVERACVLHRWNRGPLCGPVNYESILWKEPVCSAVGNVLSESVSSEEILVMSMRAHLGNPAEASLHSYDKTLSNLCTLFPPVILSLLCIVLV